MSTPRNIWNDIFQDNDIWISIATHYGLNPMLVGQDLYSVHEINFMVEKEWAYIVLITGDTEGNICLYSKYLFDSLRPHTFDKTTNEVIFTDLKIRLNIHDALSHTSTNLIDQERLFSQQGHSLVSAYLNWQDSQYQIRQLGIKYIICLGGKASSLTTASLKCGLALKRFEDFKERFPQQNFSTNTQKNRSTVQGGWRKEKIYNEQQCMPRIDEE